MFSERQRYQVYRNRNESRGKHFLGRDLPEEFKSFKSPCEAKLGQADVLPDQNKPKSGFFLSRYTFPTCPDKFDGVNQSSLKIGLRLAMYQPKPEKQLQQVIIRCSLTRQTQDLSSPKKYYPPLSKGALKFPPLF